MGINKVILILILILLLIHVRGGMWSLDFGVKKEPNSISVMFSCCFTLFCFSTTDTASLHRCDSLTREQESQRRDEYYRRLFTFLTAGCDEQICRAAVKMAARPGSVPWERGANKEAVSRLYYRTHSRRSDRKCCSTGRHTHHIVHSKHTTIWHQKRRISAHSRCSSASSLSSVHQTNLFQLMDSSVEGEEVKMQISGG